MTDRAHTRTRAARVCVRGWLLAIIVSVVVAGAGSQPAHAVTNLATAQFTNDTSASAGTTNPTTLTSGQPRFSWINDFGASVTKQRVQVVTDPLTNVVALWHLDDLLDSSGNGRNLTAVGGGPAFGSGQSGFNGAATFNGSSQAARAAATGALDLSNNFTVEVWLKLSGIPASDMGVIDKNNGTANFSLDVDSSNGKLNAEVHDGTLKTITSNGVVANNAWHHVAMTVGGGTFRMFVDGIQQTQTAAVASVTGGAGAQTYIGSWTGGPGWFGGQIDEVRISNAARTPAEILGYYKTQAPHYSTMWDSDPGDAGAISLSASCPASARCADIAYDSSGTPGGRLQPDARYYARAKFEPTAGPWNAWGAWDWFELSASPLLPASNLFTNDASAAASATRPTTILSTTPHFSLQNTSGTAASAQRLQVLNSPMSNVVASYDFDTTTGTTTDSSGNGLDLTGTTGAPTYTAGAAGFGTALTLTGTDGKSLPYSPKLDMATNFTVEAWLKTPSPGASGYRYLVNRQSGAGPFQEPFNLGFNMGTSRLFFEVTTGAGATTKTALTPSAAVSNNAWHHVAGVYDGANVLLYVDGALANSVALTGNVDLGVAPPLVVGNGFTGQIDDVVISDVARSAQELKAYYQSNKPHGTPLWDSDPTDAGIAVACGIAARCADSVYGSSGSAAAALAFAGDRYWVRGKLRTAGGAWGGWSTPDWFQTATNTAPNAPAALAQYKADGTTAVVSGAWTTDGVSTNVVLKFTASDPDAAQTLTPWVEVLPNATAFSGTCGSAGVGMFSGSGVAAPTGGTSYAMTVNVTGLTTDTLYHWRACTVDQSGGISAWVNKGASPDFKVDSVATAPGTVNDGTGADVAGTTSTSQVSGNWTAATDGSGSGVASYDWCINETADCVTTIVSSGSVTSPTVTFTKTGLTLTPGTLYYVCARTVDTMGNLSTYTCSNGQTVVAAPTTLFTDNTNASAGSANPTNILAATPHFSLVNGTGLTVNKQRTQVWSDIVDSSVVALWHLDTGTGATTDASGNAHTLTLTGAPTSPAGATNFAQALGLNGSSQYASAGASAGFNLANDFTVSAWFNSTTIANTPYPVLLQKGTSGCVLASCNFSIEFDQGLNKLVAKISAGGSISTVSTTATPFLDGTWHAVAMTVDGSNNLRLYADGVQKGSTNALAGTAVNTNIPVQIGGASGGGSWFQGKVDDVEILNRALSTAEIAGYYNTAQPHGTVLWDSDATDAGVALTSCTNGVRCADIVYGGSNINRMNARFWVTTKLKTAGGLWSGWSTPDWYQTVVNQVPNAPAALAQYKANGTTAIASGAWTTDGVSTNVVLKFTASDPDATQTLTPWVEVLPNATAFSGTCGSAGAGMFNGSGVAAPTGGTSYGMSVNVTGLSTDTQYHWRACVVDQAGAVSSWVNMGASPDFKVDSAATAPTPVNDGTGVDAASTSSTSQISGNWTAATDGSGSGVASYDWCINETADCVTTIVSSGSVTSPTVGFTKTGLTLTPGTTYYVCARTIDALGNLSAYTCSNGQTVVTAPTNLFTHDTNASSGATNPTGILSPTPHVSLVNTSGLTVNKQRTQVWSDPLDPSVVALWHMDTATGAVADATGNAHALTFTAAPTSPAGQTSFSQALGLNGTSQYASTPATSDLNLTNNFTVDAWFKTPSIATNAFPTIVSKSVNGTQDNFNIDFSQAANTLEFEVSAGNVYKAVYAPAGPLVDNAWHHAALVVDAANQLRAYVDGAQVGATTALGAPVDPTPATPVMIGNYPGSPTQFFNGQIDDVRVMNRALTTTEIAGYYNTAQPHGTVLWDSDATDAGVALASCNNGVRCADVVYGGSNINRLNARYWVTTKLKTAAGLWSGWSTPDWYQTVANVAPNAAASLAQYKANGTTAIGSGAWTTDGASTNVVLKFTASDPNSGETLTPWVEVRPNATAFSGTCGSAGVGMFTGSGVAAPTGGTSYGMTVNVTGLSTDTLYHWRACTVDVSGAVSSWTNMGGSPDFKVDAAATAPTPVNDGTGADVASTSSTSQISGNWTAATDGSGSGVASYDWCINETADCVTTIVSSGSVTSPTVGFTKTGLTLTPGTTYYVCARTVDAMGNLSTYTCSNGQTVVTAPTTLFTHDTNASTGAANPSGILAPTPHFSLVNTSGLTVNKQRTQVWSDPLDPSVVALWHMDSGTGVTTDSSANGSSLTMNAAPTTPAGPNASFNEALGLNGTTQYASRGATASLDLPNDFTVQAWFKGPASPPASSMYVTEKGMGGNANWSIVMGTNGKMSATVTVGGVSKGIGGGATVQSDGAWHHVALTVTAANVGQLYVDGAPYGASNSLGVPVDVAGQTMAIGRWGMGAGGWFAGSIDDVEVHNRALSAAEIAGSYNTAQPHGTVLWDSDNTDAGVALASCNNGVRCVDVVYGGPNINRLNARYWVTSKLKTAGGLWSGWSAPDWYQTVVDVAPNAAAALAQYKANGTTAIGSGAWTTDGASTNVVLKFTASDPNSGETLTPWVEVRPNATAFSGTCGSAGAGMFSGTGVAAPTGGTSYGMTVNVTGLSTDTLYHWRACTVDVAGAVSAWTSMGASPDFKVDSAATAPTPVNDGTGADVASTSSTSQISGNWTAASDGSGSGVASYDWCVNETADCVTTIVSSGSVTSPTVAFTKSGLTLTPGTTYYVCARTVDAMGNASSYTCSDGQTVVTAPTTLFTHDTNASAGAANPTGILSTTPHFSHVNTTGLSVTKQRTQVWSDVVDSSVLALWHMDAGTGLTTDSSGNGHSLALTGGPTSPAGQTGFGQALGFDGTVRDARVTPSAALDLTSSFTVDAWFRTTGSGADTFVVSKQQAGAPWALNYSVFLTGSGILRFASSYGAGANPVYAQVASAPYLDGQWHYVAGVYNGAALQLYVDGQLRNSAPFAGVPDTAGQVVIGRDYTTGGHYFNGDIDDVRISNRALSAAEVAGYYNTAQPHGTVLWDSDNTDAGVALASCNNGVRCADVVYGGSNINRLNARYWVTSKLKTAGGLWTPWSTPDWYQTVANVAPNAVATLAQYKADGTTAIGSGAWTTDGASTNVVLKFTASDPNSGETLTPWVEVRPNATAFSGTCGSAGAGMFSGSGVAAPTGGTSYGMSVNVTGLSTDTLYHWRACTVDVAGAVSSWTSMGASPDFKVDSAATAPTPVNDGTGADIASTSSTSQISGNWTAATDGSGSGVASYDWCINETADCVTTIVSSGSVTSPTVTFTKTGLTLVPGAQYLICVRSIDAVGNVSSYSCSDGQYVLPQPSALFTGNTSAASGTAHPTDITALAPHFSLLNNAGVAATKQRTQVVSDVVDSSVVALWHMDTATGVTTDATGNGHALTLNGAPTSPAGGTSFAQALGLNGATQWATAGTSAAYNMGNDFTVDAWFSTTTIANAANPILVQKATGGCVVATCNFSIEFDRGLNTIGAFISTGAAKYNVSVSATPVLDGTWHHAAMTMDAGNSLRLYLDGVQQGAPVAVGAPAVSTMDPVEMGATFGGSNKFQGSIDDVRIVSRALSTAEIAGYYNTAQPHGALLWDSDATDAGVALPSCNTGVRCSDIVYGGPDITRQGARYFVTTKYRGAAIPWSPWSTPDWFETLPPTMTVGVDSPTVALSGALLPNIDTTGTSTLTITTNAANGYTLTATDQSDSWGMQDAGTNQIADYAGPCGGTGPTPWSGNVPGGFGITVLAATGGATSRMAKWGTGTNTTATDFANNKYCGLGLGTSATIHQRSGYYTSPDTVTVAYRADVPTGQVASTYSDQITYTATMAL